MLISAAINLVERVFYRNFHQFSSLDEEVFVDIAILSLSQSSIFETPLRRVQNSGSENDDMVLLNWLTLIHTCYYRDKGTDPGYKGSGQDGGEEEGEGGDGRGDLQRV